MNKVIARLKQLASPLKKWGDILEVFLNYSFKEYKGFCVIPVGGYFTMSIAPLYRAKGSNDVPETAPPTRSLSGCMAVK